MSIYNKKSSQVGHLDIILKTAII